MQTRQHIRQIRSCLLQQCFKLLYGPLVFAHEPLGWLVAGDAWSYRRLRLLSNIRPATRILDLGCGSGILLHELARTHSIAIGVDPSKGMRWLAKRRGCRVVAGHSASIPLKAQSVDLVIISYPGPWVADEATWLELERISKAGADIRILLGGNYERGPFAFLRRILTYVAYGSGQINMPLNMSFGSVLISGELRLIEDKWGTALYWFGFKR